MVFTFGRRGPATADRAKTFGSTPKLLLKQHNNTSTHRLRSCSCSVVDLAEV